MEQYSRRFIEELAKHINPTILEFFNKKKNLMNFPTDNAAELIDETLMEYLEGKTSREDLMPIINKIKSRVFRNVPDGIRHIITILII